MDSHRLSYYYCYECGQPIEGDDIEARHTALDGVEDVHEACCRICHPDEPPKELRHSCWRTGTHDCAGCDEEQRRHEWLDENGHGDRIVADLTIEGNLE